MMRSGVGFIIGSHTMTMRVANGDRSDHVVLLSTLLGFRNLGSRTIFYGKWNCQVKLTMEEQEDLKFACFVRF